MGPLGDHSADFALSEQTEKDVLKSLSAPRAQEEWIHDVARATEAYEAVCVWQAQRNNGTQ